MSIFKKHVSKRSQKSRAKRLSGILIALFFSFACMPSGNAPVDYRTQLYMTDTYNGHVYTYDPAAHKPSTLSLLTAGGNANGEIGFYKGIAYIANGYSAPGVYYFDPSTVVPNAQLIQGSAGLCAQYFAFYSNTKAYFSVMDFAATAGIYEFNPSNPTTSVSTALAGTAEKNFQEVIVGSDGMIYAANYSDSTVLRIDPAGIIPTKSIAATAPGTTGLFSGTFKGNAGVFVANVGDYVLTPGSLAFIDNALDTAVTVSSTVSPSRMVQLSNGNLIATAYQHSFYIDLSGANAVVTEIYDGADNFGGLDIEYKDTLVYIPVGAANGLGNRLYVLDETGAQQAYSPVSVMNAGDAITNIGFYEN